MDGGSDGRHARLVRNHGTEQAAELLSKTANIELGEGESESVRMETPGGGGYGDPAQWPAHALARDLRDGKVTPDVARVQYPGYRKD